MSDDAERMATVSARDRSPAAVAITGLAALAVAMGIGRFAFTPILPMMQDDAGLSVTGSGWLAAANYLGYLLGAVSALAVRVPPAASIRGGLVAIGLLTLGMGVEHRVVGWLALRAAAGVASAWVLIAVSAWCLERLTPLRRPVLTGTVFAGVGVGTAAAGVFCLVAMHARASSAQAWIGLGLLSLVVTALVWPVFGTAADSSPGERRRPCTDPRHRWDRESVRLVLCYGAFGFGYIIPATFLPLMARQAIPDPSVFGWAWPIFGAAAALSTLVAAASSRYFGNRRLWMLGALVMAVGVGLPAIRPGIGTILVAGLLVGGTFMVNTMAGLQEARQVAGRNATGLIAAMTAAFGVGQSAGPICVSYAAEADGGFSTAMLVASLLLVASSVTLAQPSRPAPGPRKPAAQRREVHRERETGPRPRSCGPSPEHRRGAAPPPAGSR